MMSTFNKHKSIPAAFNEKEPIATTKPPRPTSAPFTHFSKPLAQEDAPAANPTLVAAEELQARIKAARRSRTASQPLPEAVRRKLDHSSDLMHPALRARSGVTQNPNRAVSHRPKSREGLSIDAVIRRLSMEIDGQNGVRGRVPLSDDIPPVPTLPAFPPAATYRPRPRQTASSRSSMTKRRSPLSNVSSPDDSAETSSHTSRRTSASSRTSKSEDSKDDDENDEMVRVMNPPAAKATTVKQKHTSQPQALAQLSPPISRSTSQRAKSRSSWHTLSRRSILCSV